MPQDVVDRVRITKSPSSRILSHCTSCRSCRVALRSESSQDSVNGHTAAVPTAAPIAADSTIAAEISESRLVVDWRSPPALGVGANDYIYAGVLFEGAFWGALQSAIWGARIDWRPLHTTVEP